MTNTRRGEDGFRGQYPRPVDLESLPPAKFPWLEEPAEGDEKEQSGG